MSATRRRFAPLAAGCAAAAPRRRPRPPPARTSSPPTRSWPSTARRPGRSTTSPRCRCSPASAPPRPAGPARWRRPSSWSRCRTSTPSSARVGFGGLKEEDLNKTPLFVRPRLTVGLPADFSLTVAYVPPVRAFGVKSNLLAVALDRPLWRGERWTLGGRLYGQLGTAEGSFTCTAEDAAAGDDPRRNPFGCEKRVRRPGQPALRRARAVRLLPAGAAGRRSPPTSPPPSTTSRTASRSTPAPSASATAPCCSPTVRRFRSPPGSPTPGTTAQGSASSFSIRPSRSPAATGRGRPIR